MKKITVIIIISLFSLVSVIFTGCKDNTTISTPEQRKVYYAVYSTTEGGVIRGDDNQRILEGNDTQEVIASALEGYFFVKWSDNGSTEPKRTDKNIRADMTVKAIFEKVYHVLKYQANEGGTINGKSEQIIAYGDHAVKIEAIPDNNHLFAGWSDGTFTNPRQDRNIKEDFAVTASFTKKVKTLKYVYNNATGNNAIPYITLSYDKINEAKFIVPEKENYSFKGWYLEPDFITKVTDENGKLFLGYGVFYINTENLYAKWVSKEYTSETIIYPILMVYVDEINTTLISNFKRSQANFNHIYDVGIDYNIDVNYKMSLIERKICELITINFSKYLNDLFEGRVVFELDSYFTTTPLNDKNLSLSMQNNYRNYSLWAYDIPELGSVLQNYRSVMTTFNLNDYDWVLHNGGGKAFSKYATMYLDGSIGSLIRNNMPLEFFYLNLNNTKQWEAEMSHYGHEFTHTAELCYDSQDIYEFHQISGSQAKKQYLLGEYLVNGEKVGIPFSYWEGKLDITALYMSNGAGGRVFTATVPEINYIRQKVRYGADAEEITALPRKGYRFVKWTDGVMMETRQDKNIISHLRVTAIFEPISDA